MQRFFTCEHAGNSVPDEFRLLFAGHEAVLETHRGYDIGAFQVAFRIAREVSAPLFHSMVTRLLVDLNRSTHHRSLFSEFSRVLDEAHREDVLRRFYFPYRRNVENAIGQFISEGCPVLHVSVHSFVPELNGRVRNADVGLLYDPARATEVAWCAAMRALLRHWTPELRVRRNYPYLGTADGFTTHLRKLWPNSQYAGIELEINQRILADPRDAQVLTDDLLQAILEIR
ncbi:MAG: N-formylglutamate amidohydrolase [Planctomycetaceae bacterium]